MGKWLYRKPEAPDVQGVCVVCNKNNQRKKSNGKFSALCRYCDEKLYSGPKTKARKSRQKKLNKRPYLKYRKGYCEKCGFVAQHSCQLDVDHIDGDHNNNSESNLQTLCANCHRLKTFLEEDWK